VPAERTLEDTIAFIRANTRILPVPGLPLSLYTADALTPLWQATETDLDANRLAPPFWAFPWAGGQAVARYIFEKPESVRGKRVLDLAAGSGLVAIAAAMAGAAQVIANDIDPVCEAAIALNSDLNGVSINWRGGDLLDAVPAEVDVILAGDVFYEKPMADRFAPFLQRAAAAGRGVFVGDPDRAYLPRGLLTQVADYQVETSLEIENSALKTARVWRL
jgi:predicted nicotinamide N-methyase